MSSTVSSRSNSVAVIVVKFLSLLLLCGVVAIGSAQAGTNTVKALQLSHIKSQGVRMDLFSSTRPKYRIFTLKKPSRIVIDVSNARLQKGALKRVPNNRFVKRVRLGKKRGGVRVVVDLKKAIPFKHFIRRFSRSKRYAITLDIGKVAVATHKKKRVVAKKQHTPIRRQTITVAIDPGHGGKDPGAIGARGTREKNVVLQIAKKLKKLVDKEPGMQGRLTRKGDYYISLRRRLRIARKDDADIFVSIHADAFRNRRSHGSSVFALSQRGATSEAARWLAAKENHSELGGINLSDKSDVLRSVLIDLSQTSTIAASLALADLVLTELGRTAKLHKGHVEQARFVVLKSPDVPSILVETGFLSNRYEESRLRTNKYQARLAKAILRGVKKYFVKHPPEKVVAPVAAKTKRHIVEHGDTLTSIARRYRISLASLKKANRSLGKTLRIGQILRLPT